MSLTVEPSGHSEYSAPTSSAPLDTAQQKPADPRIVVEQVRQLYGLGKAGTYTTFIALAVLWLPFASNVATWTILPPLIMQFFSQLSFNKLRARYLEDDGDIPASDWGEYYARRCLLSGSAWGLAAVMWLPGADFPLQALFSLVVACLSLNTVLTRHVYPRAMMAYTAASGGPLIFILLVTGGIEAQVSAGLGVLLWAVMSSGVRSLNRSSRETTSLRFVNSGLIDRLAEATVIAEQKAQDAERANAVARKAASSRRDFLAMVTHEIRSPLASLSGLVDLLSATELNTDQKSYAHGVQESSRLLNRLVDDLADLTEMEALSIKLRPVDMSPSEIAHAAVHLMRHDAAAHRLSLEIDELPGTPDIIHNDPDRIKQALVNLISRALRTTETGGAIVRISPVDIGGETPGVRFSVSDTGMGMPAQDAARLFSSVDFEEDRQTAHRRDVNLTICDRLVRLMGGRIGADSSVDGGFTAWFVLACAPAQQNTLHDSKITSAPNGQPQPGQMRTGQILDLDRVYELEQDLGTGRIADYLNDAIGTIADMQTKLAEACRAGDLPAVKAAAEAVTVKAEAIGLTGLVDAASLLLSEESHPLSQAELSERANQLEAKFRSGAGALRRAYPALAG